MKVSRITLQNTGIIRSLEIPCNGAVIEVSGANASGKSTIINAITALIEGGSHPELIGPNGESCLIEMEFDSGDKFQRVEGPKGYTLKGYRGDGSKIGSPAKELQSLVSGLSLNPTGLVDAKPADRVKFLQNAMPLSFTADEAAEATGDHPSTLPRVMDLQRFTAYRDGKYERRREANVALRDKESTRHEWAKALPDGDPLKSSRAESAAEAYQSDAAADCQSISLQLEEAKANLHESMRVWSIDYDRLREEISEKESQEIEAIRVEMQGRMDAVRTAKQQERNDLYEKYMEMIAAERKPLDDGITALISKLAAAQQRLADEQRQQGIRDSIIKLDREIQQKQDEANRLNDAVQNLDRLKREKLDALPIPGVEVRDGEIYFNGLSFDRQLNTAQKYLLSFQIAALTLGELPFLIFDGAEALDAANKAAFIEGMKDAGFQVVMATVVDDAPLTVQVA